MNNRVRNAFDNIHAEDALKEKTIDSLKAMTQPRLRGKRPHTIRMAALCASFVILLCLGGLSYGVYSTASAYVDIDINPSIELSINRFGRVIEASPYNNDGEEILKDIDVRHMVYDDAVKELLDAMAAYGYLESDNLLSVTVQVNDINEENTMLDTLQQAVSSSLQAHHSGVNADIYSVSDEVKTHSHGEHMSPAKYLAISELQQVDPTASYNDCRDHSVSEIRKRTQEHGNTHGEGGHEDDTSAHGDSGDDTSMPMNQSHSHDGEHGNGHH